MSDAMHPDPDTLAAFVQGRLAPDAAARLESHLTACLACCDALDAAPEARLERLLREPAPAAADAPLDGVPRVAGFEVLGELGRGGMGVVYEAYQASLNRVVALKMLHGRADAELRQRFQTEAEALARLHHPNVVQVHEVGTHQGRPFLVMEHVGGGSLRDDLERRRRASGGVTVPPREAAELVQTLARAVQHAHEAGVVHRDLKPANVLLSVSRELPASASAALAGVKITDFGLARLIDGDGPLSRTTVVAGTPSYMAPEQVRGRSVGPACDVYALGVILYELLAGRPPFLADSPAATMQQTLTRDPPPPSRLNPGVPRDLETVCLKCLAREPAQRYPSAAALADDLHRFLQGKPVTARPVGPLGRAARWAKANPLPAALVALVAVVLVAATAVSTALAAWALDRSADAEAKGEQARAGERLASRRLYFAQVQLAMEAWRQGRLARLRDLLGAVPDDPGPDDPRSFEWGYLNHLARGEKAAIPAGPGDLEALAFQPDGRLVASFRDGSLRAFDVDPGREAFARLAEGPALPLVLSPDGLLYAQCQGTKVVVREAESGREVTTVPGGWPLALGPDGRSLAVLEGRLGTLDLWDLRAGRNGPDLRVPVQSIHAVAISADRAWLAAAGADGQVRVWDVRAGQLRHALKPPAQAGPAAVARALAFSPDGTLLACGAEAFVFLWDVKTGTPAAPPLIHPGPVRTIAFDSRGDRLAVACHDGRTFEVGCARVWQVPAGREAFTLRGHVRGVMAVAFSPDSRTLATGGADGVVKLWDAAHGQEWLPLDGPSGVVRSVAFHPGGGRLAAAGHQGPVVAWDVPAGREAWRWGDAKTSCASICFSPDGTLLAACTLRGAVQVWDARDGTVLHAHEAAARSCAFSPHGQLALGRTDGRIQIADPAVGQAERTFEGHEQAVGSLAFTAAGDRLASASWDGTVRLWDVATGAVLRTLKGHDGAVHAVALTADGGLVASAGSDGSVRIWDGITGEVRYVLVGHQGPVTGLAFTPDGRRLASGGTDGLIRLWDVPTGQEVLALAGHPEAVQGVAFSPDGRQMASAGSGGAVRLWLAPAGPPR